MGDVVAHASLAPRSSVLLARSSLETRTAAVAHASPAPRYNALPVRNSLGQMAMDAAVHVCSRDLLKLAMAGNLEALATIVTTVTFAQQILSESRTGSAMIPSTIAIANSATRRRAIVACQRATTLTSAQPTLSESRIGSATTASTIATASLVIGRAEIAVSVSLSNHASRYSARRISSS